MNEEALKKLINIYSELETKLLNEIVKHFKINEEFINSDYWRAQKLEELGLLNQNIMKYIAEETQKTPEEIKKALNEIGFETLNINNLNQAYTGGLLRINPNILVQKHIIEELIQTSYNELSNRFIEVSNKIETATREAYLDVVEKAYIQTSEGISYQEAIRNCLLDLGNKGITTLTYKTVDEQGNVIGIRNYDIEGAIRRELITEAHNLTNNINIKVAEELDVEYLYLSEHVKCREQHFPWQGTVIKREDLIKVTKLGEVDGMGGPNCKHYATPYFGGARGNELKEISLEEATEQYELSQKQRYLERGIRKWKRKENLFKTAEDKEYYQKCKEKVKEWQLRNKEFTENNNLRRDFSRENVEKVTKIDKNDIMSIPNVFVETAKKQDQTISKAVERFIDKNVQENDIIEDLSSKMPFSYDKKQDKIVINKKHNNLEFYQIDEAISHEIVHMQDIRNNITENNFKTLYKKMEQARLYIQNNYSYFYNYIKENGSDMSSCDILSALSKGKLSGDFGHTENYWKNDTIIINEIAADLISSKLVNNEFVDNLLKEIPPLEELRRECMKLWEVGD